MQTENHNAAGYKARKAGKAKEVRREATAIETSATDALRLIMEYDLVGNGVRCHETPDAMPPMITMRSLNEVDAARVWIRSGAGDAEFSRGPRSKRRKDSYGLKHVMERDTGRYVGNAEFILAAALEGLSIVPPKHFRKRIKGAELPRTPNVHIYLRKGEK